MNEEARESLETDLLRFTLNCELAAEARDVLIVDSLEGLNRDFDIVDLELGLIRLAADSRLDAMLAAMPGRQQAGNGSRLLPESPVPPYSLMRDPLRRSGT